MIERPLSDRFSRLSTGIKMLLILTTALLPLGLIALFASVQSAQKNRLQHEADARAIAESGARQIEDMVDRIARIMRENLRMPPITPEDCAERLATIDRSDALPTSYGIFDSHNRAICTLGAVAPAKRPTTSRPALMLAADRPAILVVVRGAGRTYAVGVLPMSAITQLAGFATADHAITLTDGVQSFAVMEGRRSVLDHRLSLSAPIDDSDLRLLVTTHVNTVSAVEVLLVLLPILMWASAAIIGWLVMDRLVLRPLAQLQRVIAGYDPAAGPLTIPYFSTPSQEIRSLGGSFSRVTHLIWQHEADLEEGLVAQKKLTREVHHRVKNNLQVIASLINLHSRGASRDAAIAYASIQRRVDALAVVHRHHYAELEENRGVSLRALIGELTANLRATAPVDVAGMTVMLDVAPVFVAQDVAVPVAFLITEIIELVMICAPDSAVALAVRPLDQPDRAQLSVESAGLAEERCTEHPAMERFNRVVTGLSRQLRTPLSHDGDTGRYAVEIAIVQQDGPADRA